MKRLLVALLILLALPALAQRRVPPEICGRWQYVSVGSTYTGGGYSVERYVVLHPDGSYQYQGESSNSGGNGQASSSGYDEGMWWIEGEILCAQSRLSGKLARYTIELRNHPKTGEPMIVIDGDAYVTSTQRAPWPW